MLCKPCPEIKSNERKQTSAHVDIKKICLRLHVISHMFKNSENLLVVGLI